MTVSTAQVRTAYEVLTATAAHPEEALAYLATSGVFVLEVTPDVTTALATTHKACIRAPFAFTVSAVKASLHTASSSGLPTFDINKNGTTILPTKLTIDATEKTSATAATAYALSATAADYVFAADDELIVDTDVAGTGATGARVYVYYVRD